MVAQNDVITVDILNEIYKQYRKASSDLWLYCISTKSNIYSSSSSFHKKSEKKYYKFIASAKKCDKIIIEQFVKQHCNNYQDAVDMLSWMQREKVETSGIIDNIQFINKKN
ncbi:MAG: hypothetical protein Satyrvirus27_11 [Satyrvirus sp.]|uniref:Uncharacterized protein n=1 Tax=Satyrvirus sp. TaxID=2487771 RepID=A0A3G5AGA8_9VIRU|nr:MAG: hypothetical protein Satyrvirus27_11 [Satyrvirus sp.]